jgi:haloacid dehalogenase-like hydrolase
MERKEITNKGLMVIGADPVVRALNQVLTLLCPDKLNNIVLVSGEDKHIAEGVKLMQSEPHLKMIIYFPPGSQSQRDSRAPQIWDSSRVKVVNSLNLVDILAAVDELASEQSSEQEAEAIEDKIDPSILGLSLSVVIRTLGVLQHDLKPHVIEEKGETYRRIIEQARQTFGIKDSATDADVESFIRKANMALPEKMSGEISGVYCDLDDTLLMQDGSINQETLALLQEYETAGKKVIIWTGGNLQIAAEKLTGTVLERFELRSKYDYTGASAEIVIDNVSVEKFYLQYKITPRNYRRV